MSTDVFTVNLGSIRGTDSNSLLRWYDLAKSIFDHSPSQYERARADKAVQRITKELQKRNIPY